MGKKNKTTGLGKSLIRDRFGKHSHDRPGGDTFLHTSALNDGYEWGRLNLQSVTEQNNLEDFLSTAELAGTEFAAEKMNIKVIQKDVHGGLPHGEELIRIQNLQKQHKDSIQIPRRPHWEKDMTASEVDQNERAAFLEWRRSLALLQEVDGLVLTPYEKNLDFWRQLWRVIERSDVVVQIVDARNPLLFYCPDLERYVKEVDPNKVCVVLVNKADFLTQQQRDMWVDYFNKLNVRVAFWSAVDETKRQEEASKLGTESVYSETTERLSDELDSDELDSDPGHSDEDELISDELDDLTDIRDREMETKPGIDDKCESEDNLQENLGENNSKIESGVLKNCYEQMDETIKSSIKEHVQSVTSEHSDSTIQQTSIKMNSDGDSEHPNLSKTVSDCHIEDIASNVDSKSNKSEKSFVNSRHVFTGPELLDYLRSLHRNLKLTTVGMVGYPNVGKSSTINAILKMKKVPVSATPGRTKHFQTLYVDKDLMLCDCPGLVFPSFVTTKADLVISGILPIDQMRDHVPPTSLICQLIPRHLLEKVYGIIIAKPKEGEDSTRPPTAEEFLNAYGAMRGYMTSRGLPDCPRSSRYVLKDFVNGKLLYCHPPPGVSPEDFNLFIEDCNEPSISRQTSCEIIPESSAIDKEFFEKKYSTSHTRAAGSGSTQMGINSASEKPWRKHNNKRKKEKLRKVYGYLDKH